jgi:tripartite-type tricarboxylate transporter receptor subunit TctC
MFGPAPVREKIMRSVAVAVAGLGLASGQTSSSAAAGADVNVVKLYIGYSAGGGYDVYARLVARFIGKHLPGKPDVTPINMPGAGSLGLAKWLYNAAPKDGTVFGAVARGIAFDPLLNPSDKARFDATAFNWLGSANNEVSICAAWHTTGIKSIDDLKKKEMTVGGTGGAADTDQFPKVLNALLGTKMRLVTGYPGGNEINLAMQRGEVGGRCGWSWSSVVSTRPTWIKNHDVNVLVQLALTKHPDLPNVPLVMDLAKTPEQRQMLKLVFARQTMGRPFVAPPGLPADKVATLRKAFRDTMHDPELLAEAKKEKLEINPVSGEDVQQLVEEAYQVPKKVAQQTAGLLQ